MKSNINYILLALIFALVACEKERLTYVGEEAKESGVYFYYPDTYDISGNPLSYRDSFVFRFENEALNITERVYNAPVKVLGSIVDYDRTFKAKVVGGTAIEGQDFEKLDLEYKVLAGTSTSSIPFKMYRTDRLQEESIYVDLKLEESKDFKLLLPIMINKATGEEMDATRFRVRFSEIITEPRYWEIYSSSFWGYWSVKKFKILNDLMGWTTRDWDSAGQAGRPVQYGKFPYSAILLQDYLQERADKKEPVYEDDGVTLMQLSQSYFVDYSEL